MVYTLPVVVRGGDKDGAWDFDVDETKKAQILMQALKSYYGLATIRLWIANTELKPQHIIRDYVNNGTLIEYEGVTNNARGSGALPPPSNKLPIDYYRKLPLYTGNGKYIPDLRSNTWPEMKHEQYSVLLDKVKKFSKYVVTGRRRIGKSYMMTQIARELCKEGQPVFYLDLPFVSHAQYITEYFVSQHDKKEFVERLSHRMEIFDQAVRVPSEGQEFAAILAVDLIGWLLRSGVYVFIDEFQNIKPVASDFKEMLDTTPDFKGKLIVLGSHSNELRSLVYSRNEPLYGRLGHDQMRIVPCGINVVLELFDRLKLKLTNREKVFLYCCFDGLLAWYHDRALSGDLLQIDDDIMKQKVKGWFDSDEFYTNELFPNQSQVLGFASQKIRECKSKAELWKALRSIDMGTSESQAILRDLCSYHYLAEVPCHSKDVCVDHHYKKRHPQYKLTDAPLAVLAALETNNSTLSEVVGLLFEEMVREMLDNKCTTQKVVRGYWSESCTEIDIVLVDEENQIAFWGSCKLDHSKQSVESLVAHVVSYFNNRAWQTHKYFSYRHVFLFFSPTFDNKDTFGKGRKEHFNNILATGRSEKVKRLCIDNLSNYANKGAQFDWAPRSEIIGMAQEKRREKVVQGGTQRGAAKSGVKKGPVTPVATTSSMSNHEARPDSLESKLSQVSLESTGGHSATSSSLIMQPTTEEKQKEEHKELCSKINFASCFGIDKIIALDLDDLRKINLSDL